MENTKVRPVPEGGNMPIYISGALFSEAERNFNLWLKEQIVKRGYVNVFLPQELDIDFDSPTWQQDTFNTNVFHLKNSGLVVSILEGPMCDDGTSWENGFAFAKGIKVIGYRSDFRTVGPEGKINLMLGYSIDLYDNIDVLLDAIEAYAMVLHEELWSSVP